MKKNNEIEKLKKELKAELEFKKNEIKELNEKIEIAKITKRFIDGDIKKESLKAEIKKVVYRNLNHD